MKLKKSFLITSLYMSLALFPMPSAFADTEPCDESEQNLIETLSDERLQHYEDFCRSKGTQDWRLAEEDGKVVVYCFD